MVLLASFQLSNAQITSCMTGPGANGTYVDCDGGPYTYNVSECECGPFWHYSIGGEFDISLGDVLEPGFTFPVPFFMGEIIHASSSQIRIQWDCSALACCEGFEFTTIEFCGSEFFNPVIRLNCDPDPSCVVDPECDCETGIGCGPDDCPDPCDECCETTLCTTCKCVKVCGNGFTVILEPGEGEQACFKMPEEGDFSIVDCEKPCPKGDKEVKDSYIQIPDLTINRVYSDKISTTLYLEMPSSNLEYDLNIFDVSGRVVHSEKVFGSTELKFDTLQDGIYVVNMKNGSTELSHKIFIN